MYYNEVKEKPNQKYDSKTIRFIDSNDHYELIFTNDFITPGARDSAVGDILTDVVLDLKNANKNKELHVFVGSYGGEVIALTMLMQQILQFKYRVGINIGHACSCGWMLLFCCQERYVSDYSFNLYHSMSSLCYGKVAEQKNELIFHEKWWNYILDSTYTKDVLTEEELKLGETTEVFLTGKELIERGAALPYDLYLKRVIPCESRSYIINNEIYIKTGDNVYEKYVKVPDETISYKDLLDIYNENSNDNIKNEDKKENENENENDASKKVKSDIKIKKMKKKGK